MSLPIMPDGVRALQDKGEAPGHFGAPMGPLLLIGKKRLLLLLPMLMLLLRMMHRWWGALPRGPHPICGAPRHIWKGIKGRRSKPLVPQALAVAAAAATAAASRGLAAAEGAGRVRGSSTRCSSN